MDYEKKYKEALEKAKSKLHNSDKPCLIDVTEIFPELAESKNERIRKELIDLLNLLWRHFNFPYDKNKYEEFLAWLEKQDNQGHTWSEEDMNLFNNLIFLIKNSKEGDATKQGFITFINKIKSFQPHWKPTKEQIEALNTIRNSHYVEDIFGDDILYQITSLCNTLNNI